MTVRRPVVVVDGQPQLLQSSDILPNHTFFDLTIVSQTVAYDTTWTIPVALTEFKNGVYARRMVNLRYFEQFRICSIQDIDGFSTAKLRVQYSLDSGSTWQSLESTGTLSDINAGTGGTVVRTTPFVTIAPPAKTDILLRVVGFGGNGSKSAGWTWLSIQFQI